MYIYIYIYIAQSRWMYTSNSILYTTVFSVRRFVLLTKPLKVFGKSDLRLFLLDG